MLKICDFGLSKHYETSLCRSVVGTPNYLPPEVISVADDESYDGEVSMCLFHRAGHLGLLIVLGWLLESS